MTKTLDQIEKELSESFTAAIDQAQSDLDQIPREQKHDVVVSALRLHEILDQAIQGRTERLG